MAITLFIVLCVLVAVVRPRIITITNSADALTLDLHIQDFLDSRRFYSVNTVRAYEGDLKKLLSFIAADRGVAPSRVMYHELTPITLSAYVQACHQHESPGTVQRRLWVIKAFTAYIRDKYRTSDPAATVKGVVVPETSFLGLTSEQRDRYLHQLEKETPRRRIIGYTLLETGFREMSLKALRFGHLRPDWSWFEKVPSKGRGRRISIPVSRVLREELTRYINTERCRLPMSNNWPLITTRYKSHLSEPKSFITSDKTIWSDVHFPMVAAGIPKDLAHPHTLRHTFAILMLERMSPRKGAADALRFVKRALGHTNIKTTMRYLTVEDDALMEAFGA